MIGQEEMATSCVMGVLSWILEENSSLKGLSNIGTGCLGQWAVSPSPEVFKKMCAHGT